MMVPSLRCLLAVTRFSVLIVSTLMAGVLAAQATRPPGSPGSPGSSDSSGWPDPPADGAARILAARVLAAAERCAGAPGRGVPQGGAANVLWTMQALDNAACVRGLGDVDGDGMADALSGHDISGTADNLFAISGASRGVATTLWSIETQGGASGGSFWGDDCLSVGSDFTGDGLSDILAAVAWGGRTANCFDASDGTLVWQLDTYQEPRSGWVYSIHEMPDLTGDRVPEVIFCCGSTNDSLYCVDGASRGLAPRVLWSYQAGDALFSVTWVPDVSGDGLPDVVAGSGDNDKRIYCLRSDMGTPVWIHDPGGTVQSVATIQDVDGDGIRDVVAAVWAAQAAICVSSATGQRLWSQPNVGGYGMKVAPLGDADGDGIDEVLVGSWANAILCLRGKDGTVLWSTPTGTVNGGDVWTVAAIPDVNGDGFPDAVAGSFDTSVYCVDGRDGTVLWTHTTGNRVFSVSWLGDADGDGKPEVVAGTQDTSNKVVVYGIEGDSGLVAPYLVLTGTARIGGTITLHTTGLPGELFGLFLALRAGSFVVPPFGTALLDPASLLSVALSAVPANGTAPVALPIPPNPVLIGVPVFFQSLVGPNLLGGQGGFTNRVDARLQ